MPTTLFPEPNPSAIFWRRKRDNGDYEYATIQTIVRDGNGNWKALFLVPGQAAFYITQKDPELTRWEPIYALTDDCFDLVIEKIAQRVTEILVDRGAEPSEIVTAAMGVVHKETVEDAVEAAVNAVDEDYEEEELKITDPKDPDYYVDASFKSKKKEYTCGVCGKKYAYEKSLRKHLAKEHALLPSKIQENVL
jgi:hypothetical protein